MTDKHFNIPAVEAAKLTDEVVTKINAMLISIAGEPVTETELMIQRQYGINVRTQQRWKIQIRKLFGLPPRTPLAPYAQHPQIREALAYVIIRKKPSDAGTLRKAKRLLLLLNAATGAYARVEEYLLSIYTRENMTSVDAWTALRNQCTAGKVLKEINDRGTGSPKLEIAKPADLPSLSTVQRWLRNKSKQQLAIQYAKMTKQERDRFNIYVKRDPRQWRVRGFQEGDHTELDVQVINSKTGKYGRLWVSAWVDRHSSLGCGYYLTYHPDSQSIALSARNSFFGTQLKVAVPSENGGVQYRQLENFADIPDDIEIDNGKDYKSRYTGQVFGKIDFDDDVRRTIQLFTTIHYAEPFHPQSKPYIENRFRWLNEYWKKLPGYKGPHYTRKPESLRAEEKQNLIMFDWQFAQLFDLAWHAHNNRPMRRLGGLSRIQYALTHQQNRRIVQNERILDLLMMKVESRQIRRGYVSVNGIEYFSADLNDYNGEHCVVYYDPQNIGYAHIYLHGKFVTIAVKTDLIGKTEREWLEIVKMRKAKEKNLREEIYALHREISNIEAKAHAWDGIIGNVSFVSGDLIDKRSMPVRLLTGLEQQAEKVAQERERAENLAALEKKATKRSALTLLDPDIARKNIK